MTIWIFGFRRLIHALLKAGRLSHLVGLVGLVHQRPCTVTVTPGVSSCLIARVTNVRGVADKTQEKSNGVREPSIFTHHITHNYHPYPSSSSLLTDLSAMATMIHALPCATITFRPPCPLATRLLRGYRWVRPLPSPRLKCFRPWESTESLAHWANKMQMIWLDWLIHAFHFF